MTIRSGFLMGFVGTLGTLGTLVALSFGCGASAPLTPPEPHQEPDVADTPSVEELTALAAQAWIYGYPMVYDIEEMIRNTSSDELLVAAPLNLTASAESLATSDDRFVSINNDSLYHMLQADVGEEPLVLNVPATGDRYLVLQFVDAWTNNFAYLGTRATGGEAGQYLLVGPGWEGEVPEGLTVVHSPTRLFTIVGRFAVNGPSDLPAVLRLQAETWATPLSRFPEPPEREGRTLGDRTFAPFDTAVTEELVFWEKFRSWMALCPPPAAERDLIARFEPLGLLATGAESPYRNPSPELRQALLESQRTSAAALEAAIQNASNPGPTGWQLNLHVFDYNLDFFEIGTINTEEWKLGDRAEAFQLRAVAARAGLWGNHGYEAAYAMTYVDAGGEPLSGEHRYEITFETPPPVDAFWSITMYDHPNYWLVENAIDRYSIGSRTTGLRRVRGSLTIIMSHEAPPRRQRANWLPAPEGLFRPAIRMYLPREEITNGTYVPPAIRRVDVEE